MTWEYWASYRKIPIERFKLNETTPDGRPKYEYTAKVDMWNFPLYSRSQRGIKHQIGRCLNGLRPCDCEVCVYQIPKTPVNDKHCGKGCSGYPIAYQTCVWFEVKR